MYIYKMIFYYLCHFTKQTVLKNKHHLHTSFNNLILAGEILRKKYNVVGCYSFYLNLTSVKKM